MKKFGTGSAIEVDGIADLQSGNITQANPNTIFGLVDHVTRKFFAMGKSNDNPKRI